MSSWYPFGGVGPYGTYGNLGLYGALVVYSSLALTETSPAQTFIEPITLDEMKSYLKIPDRSPVDTREDDDLMLMITSARQQAEIDQNRDLVRKQWDLHHDYWPSYRIELRAPLISVDSVQYRDSNNSVTTLAENVDYIVDSSKGPGVLAPPYNATWPTFTPWPSSSLLFRFTSGYSVDDPWWQGGHGSIVKTGMKLQISQWYNRRDPLDPSGAKENPFTISSSMSYGALVRAR